jgi:murein DD-endopeptidase MepM/ murein hydrolase activator NlpD
MDDKAGANAPIRICRPRVFQPVQFKVLPQDSFTIAVDRSLAWLHRHSRQVAGALGTLLLGVGGAAFGVASLAPDPSDLPMRIVLETVLPQPRAAQEDALAQHRFSLFRSELTRSSDTAESLLSRLGVLDSAAAAFLKSDAVARRALLGRAGRIVSVETTQGNELLGLSARWIGDKDGSFSRLVVERQALGFVSRLESAELSATSRLASGTIRSSLFAATDESRIPDSVAVQLAEIFAGDIDFHRSLRKGDRFSVVYETLEADGEPLRAGRVLSAEFVNNAKTYQAMWFDDQAAPDATKAAPAKGGGYYTLGGESLRRAYLASPLEFSRMSSGFKMRLHPILQSWRAHLGVDYAAAHGTPVRSVGDGEVEFAGVQSGFGNVVYVKHRNHHVTVYAHLSQISVHKGKKVGQGEQLGAVGSSGWATGPHLHFEFRVNGVHQDPLDIAQQSEGRELSAGARLAFEQAALLTRAQLAAATLVQQASAQ